MARLNDPTGLSERPRAVVLGELAIAAGVVGQSLAVNFRGFPAMVQCELWRYFTSGVGPGQVLHVRQRKDMKTLEESLDGLQLALVHNKRLCGETSWAIQMSDSSQSRPVVFFSTAEYEVEDDPGPVLSLVCTEYAIASVVDWLAARGSTADDACGRELQVPTTVQYDPRIEALIARMPVQPGAHFAGLQQSRILRALLAGACVLRSSWPDQEVPAAAVANLDDYELVRNVLCSLTTDTSSTARDPLVADMINRANVYLSARFGHGQNNLTKAELERLDYLDKYGGNPARRELITRRELADLGNVRSATVIGLVEQLQRSRRGRHSFLRMGTIGASVSDRVWRQASARELARRLRPWSVKQVRGHFDRLRQEGLVTAERDTANGPWRYEVPDELSDASSPFSELPTAHELAADNSAA
ncbi:MAG: hypothetical protein EA424_01120 [Planctomycetaceae bacterium]|nr:MAG: hypothetical protein EA424_01120 [Planctomycetaceae bacterium]